MNIINVLQGKQVLSERIAEFINSSALHASVHEPQWEVLYNWKREWYYLYRRFPIVGKDNHRDWTSLSEYSQDKANRKVPRTKI